MGYKIIIIIMTFTSKLVQVDHGLSFHYFFLQIYVHFFFLHEGRTFVVNSIYNKSQVKFSEHCDDVVLGLTKDIQKVDLE